MTRPNWDEYGIILAQAVATRADCSRRRVGAVILDRDHRVIGTGYNGSVPGGPSCLAGECPRASSGVAPGSSYDTGPGQCIALHAEQNALLWARTSVKGCVMYITDQPCDGCRRMIVAAGIERVIFPASKSINDLRIDP